MGEKITCCFTGHRPHRLPWHEDELDPRCQRFRAELDRQVAMAYDRGYRHFISGMAQGGDLMFCEAVLKLREVHSDVVLEAAVPYPGQADRWKAAQRSATAACWSGCGRRPSSASRGRRSGSAGTAATWSWETARRRSAPSAAIPRATLSGGRKTTDTRTIVP